MKSAHRCFHWLHFIWLNSFLCHSDFGLFHHDIMTVLHYIVTVLLPEYSLSALRPLFRRRRTSSTRVQDAAWPPTFWASVTAIMTTSCCAPLVTCSTSTLASSWATPRCSAASRGEDQTSCWGSVGQVKRAVVSGWKGVSIQGVRRFVLAAGFS